MVICLLGSLLVAPVATAAPPVPELVWVDCGGGLQCATARVPLDHDHPIGPRISLALVRLPAGDPSRRIGSLILGAGGPEESGADIVRAFGRFLGTEELRARFDLVGFDPRGIDRSTPLRCFDTLAEAQAAQAPFRLRSRPRRSAPGSGPTAGSPVPARHGGPILDHMTANVARDLDLLRQALGDRFPGKVRALALDAVIDSDRLVDRTWSAFAAVNGATRAHRDAPPQVTPG